MELLILVIGSLMMLLTSVPIAIAVPLDTVNQTINNTPNTNFDTPFTKGTCRVDINLRQHCDGKHVHTYTNFAIWDAAAKPIQNLYGDGLAHEVDVYSVDVGQIRGPASFYFRWKYYEGIATEVHHKFEEQTRWDKMTYRFMPSGAEQQDDDAFSCKKNPWSEWDGENNFGWWNNCGYDPLWNNRDRTRTAVCHFDCTYNGWPDK